MNSSILCQERRPIYLVNKSVTQGSAFGRTHKFWRATGQLNLAYKALTARSKSFSCSRVSLLATAHDCEANLYTGTIESGTVMLDRQNAIFLIATQHYKRSPFLGKANYVTHPCSGNDHLLMSQGIIQLLNALWSVLLFLLISLYHSASPFVSFPC